MRAGRYIAAAFCLISSSALAGDFEWPVPSVPRATSLESLGDDLKINGIPTRIFTFTTSAGVDQVLELFRKQVDSDLTEVPKQQLPAGTTRLGGREGDFWLALKVQQVGSGAKGTWSATPRFVPNMRQRVVMPAGFPSTAKLIQQIDSYDVGKRSQMAIGVDPSPVDGVARRLEEQLREQGFTKQALPASNWPAPDRYTAVFSRAREEIWIALQQQRSGTAVTVNRLSALDVLK